MKFYSTLQGLPNVRRPKVRAIWANTVTGFMIGLRKHRAVTSAGDYGAINVWREDGGMWHCTFCFYQSIRNELTCKTKVEVKKWLIKWLPRQYKIKP